MSSALTASDLRKACAALHERHTTRILLTLVTNSLDLLADQFAKIEKYRAADPLLAETIAGYHLEGPFLSPESGYRGSHPRELMRAPDIVEFDRLQNAANGNIRLVTIAPEWPGSMEFISKVTAREIVVSLGHTNADEHQIDQAIRAGARLCTHLGNGIPVELHRHENALHRLLSRDELTACFIPDGIHIPPYALQNYFRAKPPGKAIFTTDCISAAGAPEGVYSTGWHTVTVGKDRIVRQPGQTNFAGSALSPDTGVANIHHWLSLPPLAAWDLFSTKAADIFKIALPEIEVPDDWPRLFRERF